MSRRQPARNPFSFKKIVLAIPTGGGGVSGGSGEGSVSGSASNNHFEKNESSIPHRRVEGFPVSAVHITQNIFCRQGILWRNCLCCAMLYLVSESPASVFDTA